MEKLFINEECCKGCMYCINACPKKALSVNKNKTNSKGYMPVAVDENVCIACGICYTVCPDYVFEIKKEV